MIKIRNNYNWGIIGKSIIIDKIRKSDGVKQITIKLIPLVDGFVRLPEIEILECKITENVEIKSDNEFSLEMKSINGLEFVNLNKHLVGFNNKQVLKIYPIGNTQLKVSII